MRKISIIKICTFAKGVAALFVGSNICNPLYFQIPHKYQVNSPRKNSPKVLVVLFAP